MKKKPTKKVNEAKLNAAADTAMAEFMEESKARFQQAKRIYDEQDAETQDSLDRMTALLTRIGRRRMWVGIANEKVVRDISDDAVYHNAFYMAVEIVKDLSVMDIRVASYTHPKKLCAVCGKEIKSSKKKVKK